jgi:hypothetical protein
MVRVTGIEPTMFGHESETLTRPRRPQYFGVGITTRLSFIFLQILAQVNGILKNVLWLYIFDFVSGLTFTFKAATYINLIRFNRTKQ